MTYVIWAVLRVPERREILIAAKSWRIALNAAVFPLERRIISPVFSNRIQKQSIRVSEYRQVITLYEYLTFAELVYVIRYNLSLYKGVRVSFY